MSEWPLEQFYENGFAVIENFLSKDEADELKLAGLDLCKNAPEKDRKIFNTRDNLRLLDDYFLESANKIHYFYEKGALDNNGNFLTDKIYSLNKVGHALHLLHPTFKKYTFDERIKSIAKQLDFKRPAIPQSMFIYKNPKIGSEVKPHQDATYLHTEPISAVGFWIPTEDATIENGCLWFIKGSHKNGLRNRFVRNPSSGSPLIYEKPDAEFPQEDFIACPVKMGSLVIIHGLVVHQSECNRSNKSRYAYTFHVIETQDTKYSANNWLQLPEGEQFAQLFE